MAAMKSMARTRTEGEIFWRRVVSKRKAHKQTPLTLLELSASAPGAGLRVLLFVLR